MAKPFRALLERMDPARRARVEERVRATIAQLPLDELREARDLTQTQLAATLGVDQAQVSKLERRADMYVSTLRRFIQAMGGELEIRAHFPDGEVRIDQFGALTVGHEAPGPRERRKRTA
jgi:transcriptional regulator with XRE-family HTH domain